jgi:DNA-binding transcriptional MocR family regulator
LLPGHRRRLLEGVEDGATEAAHEDAVGLGLEIGGDEAAGAEEDSVAAGGAVGCEHGLQHPPAGLSSHGPMTYDWSVSLQANRQTNRDPDLALLLNGWSDSGHGTLPRRLAHALRRSIQSGVLPADHRLPPERQLADELSVSRATVTQALDELRGEGLLESTPGRGTFVVVPSFDSPGTRVAEHHLHELQGIDLATGNPPDPAHLPPVSVNVSAMLADGGGPGMSPLGLLSLRAAIAAHVSANGRRRAEVENVHITSGAHQAISLLLGCLTGPSRPVMLEQPNYPGLFDIADGLGTEVVPLRGDDAGILPESLQQAIRDRRASVLYVQAGPHNPSGRVMAAARVERLAEIVDRADVTVIEDSTLGPLAFDGAPPPLFADHCRTATVCTIGSLSKVAWAGLRIGWLVAPPPIVDRSLYLRLGHDLGPSVPSELLALALMPHFDSMAATRRATLAESVDRSIAHLSTVLPEASIRPPDGGSVLWLELPIDDSAALVHLARRHGVRVAPGSISVAGRMPGPFVRVCVDRPWELVSEGLDRLARAWRDLAVDRAATVLG